MWLLLPKEVYAVMAEQADARDFDVLHTKVCYKKLQRVPKGKPLEQNLAKTVKASTERRAKWIVYYPKCVETIYQTPKSDMTW